MPVPPPHEAAPEPEAPPPAPAYRPGCGFAFLALVYFLGAQVVAVLLMFPFFDQGMGPLPMVLALALSMVLAQLVVWRAFRDRLGPLLDPDNAEFLGLVAAPRRLALGSALAGVLLAAALIAATGFEAPEGTQETPMAALVSSPSTLVFALWVLVAVVLAPIVEEFVFRGVILGSLVEARGEQYAAVTVILTFFVLHLTEVVHDPYAAAAILTLSIGTVALRLRSGSLLPAYLLHLFYNGTLAVGVAIYRATS